MSDDRLLRDHVFVVEMSVSPEQVWNEITKTGRIQRAMHNTILEGELTPGSKLRYYSPDRKRVFVVGEVIEVDPPFKLSHSFMFTMRSEQPTLVTWEIEETADGCRVTLTHGDWTDQNKTHEGVIKGWLEILDLLKTELETGDIPLKVKLVYKLMGAMMFILPRSTRVSEVEASGW